MGFQDMVEVVHKAASSKGGKIRGRKGLAAMSPEKRREIQSKGGKARHEDNDNKAAKQRKVVDVQVHQSWKQYLEV